MKRQKRFIALLLSLALCGTLFVQAAGDEPVTIPQAVQESIERVTKAGIMQGDASGFRAADPVTRAEMAHIVVLLGGAADKAKDLEHLASFYVDIEGHWAQNDIKYCRGNGVVSGANNTQFHPDDAVTGTEALKMVLMLVAEKPLDYPLTGRQWAERSIALGSEMGLLDGLSAPLSKPLPRMYVAQLVSNALDVTTAPVVVPDTAQAAIARVTDAGLMKTNVAGDFCPGDKLLRAELAQILFTMHTGKTDASAYEKEESTFKDVNGHWAQNYIQYCVKMGFMSGDSETMFRPDDYISGAGAAKVMLAYLGYDAEKYHLIGENWEQNTLIVASEIKLLEHMNQPMTARIKRMYAAQLISNVLDISPHTPIAVPTGLHR